MEASRIFHGVMKSGSPIPREIACGISDTIAKKSLIPNGEDFLLICNEILRIHYELGTYGRFFAILLPGKEDDHAPYKNGEGNVLRLKELLQS